jgi:predicted nuclease with TOPRIM domain
VTLDYDEASRVPALLADKAALMGERDRLRAERDRARGTAATLEAENARLREGIERLCSDIDNPLRERHDESPHDLPEVAEDLRALLADTDSAQAEGGE